MCCAFCVSHRWFAHLTQALPRLHLSSPADDKNCELFTHTLVLQRSPSSSSHQPQTTHVFADSRITLLCHALRICVAHAPTESCPFSCLYIELFELVIEVSFHYCTTTPCHKIDLFKHPVRGSRYERLDNAVVCLLTSSLFTLNPHFCQVIV